jgi:hypothetical protein
MLNSGWSHVSQASGPKLWPFLQYTPKVFDKTRFYTKQALFKYERNTNLGVNPY